MSTGFRYKKIEQVPIGCFQCNHLYGKQERAGEFTFACHWGTCVKGREKKEDSGDQT